MLKRVFYVALIASSISPIWALPARAEKCVEFAVQVDDGIWSQYTNCSFPDRGGVFQNNFWEISIAHAGGETAHYIYKGRNRKNGSSLQLTQSSFQGTTERSQYVFRNGNYKYIVTIRPSDPNTIRLEVYQGSRVILNQLLNRVGDYTDAENNVF